MASYIRCGVCNQVFSGDRYKKNKRICEYCLRPGKRRPGIPVNLEPEKPQRISLDVIGRYTELNAQYLSNQRERKRYKVRIRNKRRNAIVVRGTFSQQDWETALEFFDHKCAYCGGSKRLTMDHLIPLTKGGEHMKHNIIPACMSCNTSKNNKDAMAWYKKRTSYSVDRENKINDFINSLN